MNPRDDAWRLRQQAAQLTRLFIDAGWSGTETLETVSRLGRHLDARTELSDDAAVLGADVRHRSAQAFEELDRLTDQADHRERSLNEAYRRLGEIADVETAVAAGSTDLLDTLQSLYDA